jgi:hypothetical protein
MGEAAFERYRPLSLIALPATDRISMTHKTPIARDVAIETLPTQRGTHTGTRLTSHPSARSAKLDCHAPMNPDRAVQAIGQLAADPRWRNSKNPPRRPPHRNGESGRRRYRTEAKDLYAPECPLVTKCLR